MLHVFVINTIMDDSRGRIPFLGPFWIGSGVLLRLSLDSQLIGMASTAV